MRLVEVLPELEPLKVKDKRGEDLEAWISTEIEDALSARMEQEKVWREVLRMYEGVPKEEAKNWPIENAPNTEITLGAIASDTLYASLIDLIFTVSPTVTIRPTGPQGGDAAKAMQRFVNWVTDNEADMRKACEHTLLDDVQLGTGVYYIPWVDQMKKTDVHRVLRRGPKIFSIPPEDFLVPGGVESDLQTAQWCAMRRWLTEGELRLQGRQLGWDLEGVSAAASTGWVRHRRERMGHSYTSGQKQSGLYEILDVYCYFDVDDDGIEEDLLVTWDRTSRKILKLRFNPYEKRPFEPVRYQLRSHMFYGIGVLEMLRSFQAEVTRTHNERVLNMLLANSRIWLARDGAIDDTLRIWPGKVIHTRDPTGDILPFPMADVYPSSAQAEAVTIGLAQQRTGVSEAASLPGRAMGGRTPGITAMTAMQASNRRFTPPFDAARIGTANAVKHCIVRYQERLLAGDVVVEDHIRRIMGEDAELILETLRDTTFDEGMVVEMTASSSSINREAERQSAMMLLNILSGYYQRTLELAMLSANPQIPPEVKETAQKISKAASEVVEKVVRTFDSVRDPEQFIVAMEEQLGGLEGSPGSELEGLLGMLGGSGEAAAEPAGVAGPGQELA